LDCAAVAAIHPFYTASIREFETAGRPIIGSAPVGADGTAAWLQSIGDSLGLPQDKVGAVKDAMIGACKGALASQPINGRITVSGYEGSELLVARLLIESGADVRYVGSACPKTKWSDPDREWLEARGVHVNFRASLEEDIAAVEEFQPDLAIGTTPVVQHAKAKAIPSLYFTNLISARPLMGPAGAGSLAQVVNAAMSNKDRFDKMRDFFKGVGDGHTSGVWEDTPVDRPKFRKKYAALNEAARKAAEAVGT
ncbi:MAG: nitrogenase component 1, partial [Pseudomonadota bacterium]